MMITRWTFDHTKLRTLMGFKGLSRNGLGAAIGKTGVTIANWEQGKQTPTAKDLVAIANAFDIDPASFFHKSAEKGA